MTRWLIDDGRDSHNCYVTDDGKKPNKFHAYSIMVGEGVPFTSGSYYPTQEAAVLNYFGEHAKVLWGEGR
jgi:hypothetical protein